MSDDELWDDDDDDDDDDYPFLKNIDIIFVCILYLDLIFSIWDWIEPNTFLTLLDRIFITFNFSSISLFAYFFSKLYEIYRSIWLYLQNDEYEAEDVNDEISRMKKIYNIVYGIILFGLSRFTEFFIFNAYTSWFFYLILLVAVFIGFLIISPSLREQLKESLSFYAMTLTLYLAPILIDPDSFFILYHHSTYEFFGLAFSSSFLIFGIYFTSNYLVNKKMKDTWEEKILKMNEVLWKDYIKAYKFHFLGLSLYWGIFILTYYIITEGL